MELTNSIVSAFPPSTNALSALNPQSALSAGGLQDRLNLTGAASGQPKLARSSFSSVDLPASAVGRPGFAPNVYVGDFNGDGKDDFLRQSTISIVGINDAEILLSKGNGGFTRITLPTEFALRGDLTNLFVGDFNGDGKDDFMRQEKGIWDDDFSNTFDVFLSNGDGSFQRRPISDAQSSIRGGDFSQLTIIDFNGDGADDFLLREIGPRGSDGQWDADLFISQRDGTFSRIPLPSSYGLRADLTNVVVGDFNGDGRQDFIRQEKSFWDDDLTNTADVFLSVRGGPFNRVALPESYALKGDFTNLHVGDFNGDGKDDILRQSKAAWDDDNQDTAQILLSNGNGTFNWIALPESFALKGDFTNLHIGDFNGDRKDDILRQSKGIWDDDNQDTAQILFSNGNGTFTGSELPERFGVKGDLTNLYIGNFNGDRRSDFIRQSKFLQDATVFLAAETASIGFQANDRSLWAEGGAAKFGDQRTLQTSWNFDLNRQPLSIDMQARSKGTVGLKYDFQVTGGEVDAAPVIDLSLETQGIMQRDGKITVTPRFDVSDLSSFSTVSPAVSFDLSLLFGMETMARIENKQIVNFNVPQKELQLFKLRSGQFEDLPISLPDTLEDLLGVEFALSVPDIQTTGQRTARNTMTASGEDTFLSIGTDLDHFLTEAIKAAIGVPPGIGSQLLALEGGMSIGGIGLAYNVFDLDLLAKLKVMQEFSLNVQQVTGQLVLEGGGIVNFTAGQSIDLTAAQIWDVNGDGILGIETKNVNVAANFTNRTRLGLDASLDIEALSGTFASKSFGPLYDRSQSLLPNGTVPLVDLYNKTFTFNGLSSQSGAKFSIAYR